MQKNLIDAHTQIEIKNNKFWRADGNNQEQLTFVLKLMISLKYLFNRFWYCYIKKLIKLKN